MELTASTKQIFTTVKTVKQMLNKSGWENITTHQLVYNYRNVDDVLI